MTKGDHSGSSVQCLHLILSHREHTARATGRIKNGDNLAIGSGNLVHIRIKQYFHHQLNNLTGRKVLTGGLVRLFREPADQFFKHITHFQVINLGIAHIDLGKPLYNQVQQVCTRELVNYTEDFKVIHDLTDILGETIYVITQVRFNGIAVIHQLFKIELADVVVVVASHTLENGSFVADSQRFVCFQDLCFGRGQHTVKTAQDSKWQDYLAVFALLKITTEQVCDTPYEICLFVNVHQISAPSSLSRKYRSYEITTFCGLFCLLTIRTLSRSFTSLKIRDA